MTLCDTLGDIEGTVEGRAFQPPGARTSGPPALLATGNVPRQRPVTRFVRPTSREAWRRPCRRVFTLSLSAM